MKASNADALVCMRVYSACHDAALRSGICGYTSLWAGARGCVLPGSVCVCVCVGGGVGVVGATRGADGGGRMVGGRRAGGGQGGEGEVEVEVEVREESARRARARALQALAARVEDDPPTGRGTPNHTHLHVYCSGQAVPPPSRGDTLPSPTAPAQPPAAPPVSATSSASSCCCWNQLCEKRLPPSVAFWNQYCAQPRQQLVCCSCSALCWSWSVSCVSHLRVVRQRQRALVELP
jgi:hypothetical protein